MKSNYSKQVLLAPHVALSITQKLLAFLLALIAICSAAATARSQQAGNNQTPAVANPTAPRPEVQQAYRSAPRDPFKRDVKRPEAVKGRSQYKLPSQEPKPLAFPSLTARREEFKRLVDMAASRDMPEPSPISQYLVSELEVTGVFRDDRGYGAFLRAQPTGTMFFIRGGTRVYNGEVLRVDSPEAGALAQVQFREVTFWEKDGKRSPQEKVVTKTPVTTASKK